MSTIQELEELKSDLLLSTVYIHRLLRNQARNSTESWSELAVLNNLDHWGGQLAGRKLGSLTQKELAQHELVSQAAMSNLVKKLRTRDLVHCEKSTSDSRTTLVSLTPKGRRHLAKQGPMIKQVLDQLLEGLTQAELRQLAKGQQILSKALKSSQAVQRAVSNSKETNTG